MTHLSCFIFVFPINVEPHDLIGDKKEADKEEKALYAGTQLEFCLLSIQVCKEVIPLCHLGGIGDSYCCRSKAFYWPLFKKNH